jgi:hypothetical protein
MKTNAVTWATLVRMPGRISDRLLENAVGNIQSFTQRTQRTAEKHREDQEKLDIHDD